MGNRLVRAVNRTAATNYHYDPNANLNEKVQGSTTRFCTFGYNGFPSKVAGGGSAVGSFGYDGQGRRVKGVEGGTTTYYLFAGGRTVLTVAGASTTAYLYANGLLIAEPLATLYLHQDLLGSVRLITTSSAGTNFASDYRPFGGQVNAVGTDQNVKFSGQWRSTATSLDYMGARWFDPSAGRFIGQDSILGHLSRPQRSNRYVYTQGNPVNYVDPTGQDGGYAFDRKVCRENLKPGEFCTFWGSSSDVENGLIKMTCQGMSRTACGIMLVSLMVISVAAPVAAGLLTGYAAGYAVGGEVVGESGLLSGLEEDEGAAAASSDAAAGSSSDAAAATGDASAGVAGEEAPSLPGKVLPTEAGPVTPPETLPADPFDLGRAGYDIIDHDFIPDTRGGGYQVIIESPGGYNGVYHSGYLADILEFEERDFPEELHLGPHCQLYGPEGMVRLAPGDLIPEWFR